MNPSNPATGLYQRPLPPAEARELPTCAAAGNTPISIPQALHQLDRQFAAPRVAGGPRYRKRVMLITHGQPTDDVTAATCRARAASRAGKLNYLLLNVAPTAAMGLSAWLGGALPPKRLAAARRLMRLSPADGGLGLQVGSHARADAARRVLPTGARETNVRGARHRADQTLDDLTKGGPRVVTRQPQRPHRERCP